MMGSIIWICGLLFILWVEVANGGIAGFNRYVQKQFPRSYTVFKGNTVDALLKQKSLEQTTPSRPLESKLKDGISSASKASDVSSPVKPLFPVDHLCIDMNCLLHNCYRSSKSDLLRATKRLYCKLDDYMSLFQPKESLVLAYDGTAPFAKLLTQRIRRIQSPEAAAITPGSYMMNLFENITLNYFIQRSGRANFQNVTLYLSSSLEAGEGELKLLQWVHQHLPYTTNYSPHQHPTILLVGADSDILLQSMCNSNYSKNLMVLANNNKLDFNLFNISTLTENMQQLHHSLLSQELKAREKKQAMYKSSKTSKEGDRNEDPSDEQTFFHSLLEREEERNLETALSHGVDQEEGDVYAGDEDGLEREDEEGVLDDDEEAVIPPPHDTASTASTAASSSASAALNSPPVTDLLLLFILMGNDYIPKLPTITFRLVQRIYAKTMAQLPPEERYIIRTIPTIGYNFYALWLLMHELQYRLRHELVMLVPNPVSALGELCQLRNITISFEDIPVEVKNPNGKGTLTYWKQRATFNHEQDKVMEVEQSYPTKREAKVALCKIILQGLEPQYYQQFEIEKQRFLEYVQDVMTQDMSNIPMTLKQTLSMEEKSFATTSTSSPIVTNFFQNIVTQSTQFTHKDSTSTSSSSDLKLSWKLPEQEEIQSYLQGILWNIDMYYHAKCVDYSYQYMGSGRISPVNIKKFIQTTARTIYGSEQGVEMQEILRNPVVNDQLNLLVAPSGRTWYNRPLTPAMTAVCVQSASTLDQVPPEYHALWEYVNEHFYEPIDEASMRSLCKPGKGTKTYSELIHTLRQYLQQDDSRTAKSLQKPSSRWKYRDEDNRDPFNIFANDDSLWKIIVPSDKQHLLPPQYYEKDVIPYPLKTCFPTPSTWRLSRGFAVRRSKND